MLTGLHATYARKPATLYIHALALHATEPHSGHSTLNACPCASDLLVLHVSMLLSMRLSFLSVVYVR
jgi:hypothetical protein